MSSYISTSEMKRRIYLFLLLIFFFFVFDRSGALLFRELNYSFYSKTKIKRSIFGKSKIIKKGFYDTMIFGTSRSKDAIHPLYLNQSLGLRAFKESKPSRYPRYFYHFYRKFRSVFGKPVYLFYGIDYFIFNLKTSDLHMMMLNKKRKVRKIDYKKIVKKNSSPLAGMSLLYAAKKKIDNTVSDVIYKISIDLEPGDRAANVLGIEKYTGKKRTLGDKDARKPVNWDKFEYVNSDHGEGKYLKLLFDELEKDGVMVFLIGIPDFIGTYQSNYNQDRYENDVRSLMKGRKNFWFLNYDRPEKFDLDNRKYFTNGGWGQFNSHMSYFGAIPLNKLLAEDVGKIISTGKKKSHE